MEGLLCKANTDECCMLSGCHGALPASLQEAGQPLGALLPALCVRSRLCQPGHPFLLRHLCSVGSLRLLRCYKAALLLHVYLSSHAVLVVQTKCCLLALDFETSDYTCDLFSVIFDALR